jgi:hypothetical protein
MLTEIDHDIFGIAVVDLRKCAGNIFHPTGFDGALDRYSPGTISQ